MFRTTVTLVLSILAGLTPIFGAGTAHAALPLAAAPGSPYTTLDQPEGLGVGDFNRDGRDDVLVGNRDDQSLALLLGQANGSLAAAPGSPFAVGHGLPVPAHAADMNGDGLLDAVSASATGGGSGKVSVLLGNGQGGLAPAAGSPYAMKIDGPNQQQSLGIADFDADGRLDVVGVDADQLSVLHGTGGGALAQGVITATLPGTKLESLAIGDFTGDGRPDVFTGDEAPLYKGVLFQNVAGSLVAALSKAGFGDNPSAGDVNGDGRDDVLSVTTGPSDIRGFTVTGNVFTAIAGLPDPGFNFLQSTRLDDLDADGRLDLVISGLDGHVGVLKGSGAASLASFPGSPLAVGSDNRYATTGDVDGNGQPDVVYGTSDQDKVGVLLNGNAGGLAAPAGADFGSATIGGTTVERTVTLTSNGTGFLAVRSATLTGVDAGDVTKVADTCTARRVVIGGTCDITVRFAPQAAGARAATLAIADNTPAGTHAVALTGQGVATPAPKPQPKPQPKPKPDTTRPVVSVPRFTRGTFRVGAKPTAKAAKRSTKKTKAGSTLTFTASEAATVRITVQHKTVGRRVGPTCKKATRALHRRKPCTRYVKAGTLTRAVKAGHAKVAFSGRIGSRRLTAGRYRVSITARDKAGNATKKAATRTFRIVGR